MTGIEDRVSSLVSDWIGTWQNKLLEYMKKEAESSSCLAGKMAQIEGETAEYANMQTIYICIDDTLKCVVSLEHLLYPRSQIKASIVHFCKVSLLYIILIYI